MPSLVLHVESVALASVLPLLLFSCGRIAHDTPSASIDGARTESDAAVDAPAHIEEIGFSPSVGVGIEACSRVENADAGALVRLPEFFTVFRFVGASECDSLDRSALLRNAGTPPVRILGITFDRPEFSTVRIPLPTALTTGQAISIPIRFRGDQNAVGQMTVVTDSGCPTFDVRAVTSSDALFDFSAAALDFGDVVMGGASEPTIFNFQMQFATLPPSGLDEVGFGVGPVGAFEIVSGPQSPVRMRSCEPVELQLRFKAPQLPGPVVGQLGYGVGPGDGFVELYGRAVQD